MTVNKTFQEDDNNLLPLISNQSMQISDQNNSIEYKLPLNNEQMYEKLINRLGKDRDKKVV